MAKSWLDNFGWSKTSQGMWDQCKTQFYLHYVAAYELPSRSLLKDRIWDLRRRQRFVFLGGSLIHDALKAQLAHIKAGREFNLSAAMRYLEIEAEKWHSRKADLIDEINGRPIEEGKFDTVISDGKTQLQSFEASIWPCYAESRIIDVDFPERFFINGSVAWAAADLVTVSPDDRIVITDWKTGQEWEKADDSDQLTTYISWAMKKFDRAPEEVAAEFVYLRLGYPRVTSRTSSQVEEFDEWVVQMYNEMTTFPWDADNLESSPQADKCFDCNFMTICTEGQELLGGNSTGDSIPMPE